MIDTAADVQNVTKGISNSIDHGFDKLQQSKFGQSKLGGAVTDGAQRMWDGSPHKPLMTDAKGTVQQAGENIKNDFAKAKDQAQQISDAAKSKVDRVKAGAKTKIGEAKNKAKKAQEKVSGFVGGLFKKK